LSGEVPVAVWRGIAFVSIAPAADLITQLGELPNNLLDTPLENMLELESLVFRAAVNWKAYLDQFTEYYHVPAVHSPDKAGGLEGYTALPFKGGMCMEAPRGATYWASKWLWNWPNWTISTFPGGAKISRIMPLSAREIEVRFFFLFEDAASASQTSRQRIIDATASIFAEDIAACEKVQPNYNSGEYRPGPLHPRHEQSTAYLHALVRRALDPKGP
jgi:choline monooxygenase